MAWTTSASAACAAAALTMAVALTATGCAGGTDADRTPAVKPSPSATEPSPSAGNPSPSVAAADGADTAACADGDCEIAVSEPVTFRFKGPKGMATLSVTKVGPNEIEYSVQSDNGRSKAGASGPGQGCLTVLRDNGSGNSCGGLGDSGRPSAEPGTVVIQAATGADGTAVLHVVTG
ncbi:MULTISPECIES: hypothetical protein [Streptomyces]|uniref:Uncharacterized protein n=1 Tax=Streptomyces cadmiisoli TaxID=2184053 RepID=A0A2Z4J057_9ACTN|nr:MULTISPECIES: hypothetical protein [Streptomyces]AWW37833.1 hypothetical protein DN051_15195 [Streptomyces cadmiisoli]